MANTSKKGVRNSSRKKIYMKKSVRRTIAALLMVTALIVALIPVEGGGVNATTESSIPSIEELSFDTSTGTNGTHSLLKKKYTNFDKIKGGDVTGNTQYAFPYDKTIVTTQDTKGKIHTYYKILQGVGSGMPSVPVPIFRMGQDSASHVKNYINQYIGGNSSGYNPPNGTVSLSDTVIVNAGQAEADPFFIGEPDVINNKKDGTYEKYMEAEYEGPIAGTSEKYKIVQVTREDHKVTKEETPSLISENVIDVMFYDDIINTEIYYVCKDDKVPAEALVENINFISDKAFMNSGHITSITIPRNINAVGNSAFENSGIQSANIDTLCKFIGDRAFYNCQSMTGVEFSDTQGDLEFIGDCAFANTGLTAVKIPKSNNLMIGTGAFANCLDLENVDFSNTNRTITMGCYVFGNDRKLTDVDLKNVGHLITHKSLADEDEVGCGIFSGCTNLYYATFDDTYFEKLTRGTFADCPNLYSVKFKNGNASFYNKKISSDPDVYDTDFKGLSNSFHIWGDGNDNPIHNLCTQCAITYRYDLDKGDHFEYFDANGYRYDFSPIGDGNYIITNIDDDKATSPVLDIPYSVCDYYNITEIGERAASNLTEPTQVFIPDSFTNIGNQAFSDMPNVTSVYFSHNRSNATGLDIPQADALTIGEDAFYNDAALGEIHLRHYAYEPDGTINNVYDPNIVSIGTSVKNNETVGAFYTANPSGTKIYGSMYNRNTRDSYYPFEYCMDKSTGKCNNKRDGYVEYITDGPELLEAKYDVNLGNGGEASLTSYPTNTAEVLVGRVYNEITKEYEPVRKTLTQVLNELNPSSPDYNYLIKESFESIYVPKGITSIEDVLVTTSDGTEKYFQNLRPVVLADGTQIYTSAITIADVKKLPNQAFASISKDPSVALDDIVPSTLNTVTFENDLWDIGNLPFLNSSNVVEVNFSEGENPRDDTDGIAAGNKSYRRGDGIVYCTEYHEKVGNQPEHYDNTLVEFLPGVISTEVVPENDITRIENGAFENCDAIYAINLKDCEDLKEEFDIDPSTGKTILHPAIPDNFAYDANNLKDVSLPSSAQSIGEFAFSIEQGNTGTLEEVISVTIPSIEIEIDPRAFLYDKLATLYSYPDSAAERFANLKENDNVIFSPLGYLYTVTFLDYDGRILSTEVVQDGAYVQNVPTPSVRPGYTFIGWNSNGGKTITDPVHSNVIFVPIYEYESSSSSSSSSSSKRTSSSSSGGSSSTPGGSSSSPSGSSSSSSSSRSSSSSGSSSSSSMRPVVVSGAPAPFLGAATPGTIANPGTAGGTTGGNGGVSTGNTNVTSSVSGIPNNGKMSATVNGSSDNYIIKITETEEANNSAVQALSGAFGSLDAIRYVPFDISLYDSTGTQKISPVPDGVTVSITMPIPSDLTIYGGNNKIGSTLGGVLETIQPRFTVIDGVPCMNYTVSHLSPYVVYVDTNNLTEAGISDATPKTGDPIHPKWFLAIGLAAFSVLLFLKRDKGDMVKAARS